MKNIFKKDLSIPLDIVSKRHFKLYASIFLFGFSSICASDALAQSKKVSEMAHPFFGHNFCD